MIRLTFLAVLLLIGLSLSAQSGGEDIFTIDESSVIVDTDRNRITFEDFMAKMETGDYQIETSTNDEGTTIFVLRAATATEKEAMSDALGGMEDMTGKKAPDYSFTDLNGKTISSVDMAGKVLVLNFWFTTCKPCVKEMKDLNKVYEKYKEHPDVVFLAPSYEAEETITSFLEKKDFRYPAVALAQKQARIFGIDGYPANIVIDRQGIYSLYFVGGVSGIDGIVERSIERALK